VHLNNLPTFDFFAGMRDLTTGRVGEQILKFTAPMLLGNLFQQTYNIVDCIIVGKLIGKEALAAVGASFPIIFMLISFVIGIASGGTVVISQYFGAKDYLRVRKAIDTMYIFIFFASILIMAIGITFSEDIFRMIRLPAEIIPQATSYLKIFLLGTIVLFGFNGTCSILRGIGDSVTPLLFLIISSLINILLAILFVKYFGWGIKGAAWATVISQAIAFFSAVIYLNKTHKLIQLRLKEITFDREIFWKSINIGLPSGFQQTFVSMGMIALFRIVNGYGANIIAAYSVAGRIDNFAMMPAMNFGQALSTFTGQNIGANKKKRVRSGLIATLGISIITSAIISMGVILLRYPLMKLFTNDVDVIAEGAKYLLIVGSCYMIFSAMFSFNGLLRGAGDTLIPMFITLLSLWIVRIPFAYLLSNRIGEIGIWWAVPIAWAIGAIFSFLYYLTGNWKNKAIVKYDN
jgi:putative MATE family efflux protein